MVSAQVPCLIRLYRKSPAGNRRKITQARVEDLAPAGGASEGAGSAVATPEKRFVLDSPVVLSKNDVLIVTGVLDAGATLDATDCVWSIPLVTEAGSDFLGRAQFASPTLGDTVVPAGLEIDLAGYTITQNSARVAGKIYLDIRNNA